MGFPSDSVYHVAACALFPEAVAKLKALCPRQRLTLALAFPMEVFDWLPFLKGAGLRVARRLWPGACTLVCGQGTEQGQSTRLAVDVRRILTPDGLIALTIPNHSALRQAAYHLAAPLVVGSPVPAPRNAQDLAATAGDQVAWVLDGGEAADPRLPTVVRVDSNGVQVEHEGAIGASEVEAALPCRIVFICTGNTCRSPMAQALCMKMLADWLGCSPEALPRHGYLVQSAGLAALAGEEASPEGVVVMSGFGADLSRHRSQPLSYELLAQADFVFAMTRSHLHMLRDLQVDVGPACRLLSCTGEDVPDPIGGPPEVYQECERQIRSCLEGILPELQENR